MSKIWSIQAVEYGKLAFVDIEEPVIQRPDEIIIEPAFSAIGRLEVASFYGKLPLRRSMPYVLGSEMAGTIRALGPEAKKAGFYVGQRVSGLPWRPCGVCYYCRNGAEHLCTHLRGSGTMSRYIKWSSNQTISIPEGIPTEEGTFIPTVNKAFAILKMANPVPGGSLLVLGCHGLALLCVMLAKQFGISKTAVVGREKNLCDLAVSLGADFAANCDSVDDLARVSQLMGYRGYHTVIDTMVDPMTSRFGFEALMKGGTLVLSSIAMGEITLDAAELCWKEADLKGFYERCRIDPRIESLLPELNLKPFAEHQISYTKINEAVETIIGTTCLRYLIRHST